MISMYSFGVSIPRLLFIQKSMQNDNVFFELHRVDGTICASGIISDNLNHAGTINPLRTFAESCWSPA
jgi:hypothetical protein